MWFFKLGYFGKWINQREVAAKNLHEGNVEATVTVVVKEVKINSRRSKKSKVAKTTKASAARTDMIEEGYDRRKWNK